jgi:hypothetical protein
MILMREIWRLSLRLLSRLNTWLLEQINFETISATSDLLQAKKDQNFKEKVTLSQAQMQLLSSFEIPLLLYQHVFFVSFYCLSSNNSRSHLVTFYSLGSLSL